MRNKIINKNLGLSTGLCLAFGVIALFVWLQSRHTAEVSIEKHVYSQKTIVKPVPPIVKSDTLATSGQDIHLVLKRSVRKLYVYQGDTLQDSYPVAVGKPGWETPTGKFKVIEMLKNPDWTNPETGKSILPGAKDNPLGERWIAFWNVGRKYIGFHGTPDRTSVGKPVSHGCVRMYNEDARKLYELVKLGTPVSVEP